MNTTFDNLETYRMLFEQINDAVFFLSLEGAHLHANRRACEMLGYEISELLTMGVTNIVVPRELNHSSDIMRRLRAGDMIAPYERIFRRKDGTEFPVEVNVQLVRDAAGQPLYIQSIVRDITRRKHIEAELRLSEERFRHMIHDLNVGVVIHGPQVEIVLVNKAALNLLGLTEDQMLGKTSFDPDWNVIHEDGSDFPGETHPAVRALMTGKPARSVVMGVYRPISKDRVWLLVNAEPELDGEGHMKSVMVTFTDITALHHTQERVEQSERLLSTVFRTNPIAISISTLEEGRYIDVNSSFAELTGFSREELIGHTAHELNMWAMRSDRSHTIAALRQHGRVHQAETFFRLKNGEVRPALVSLELIDIKGTPHILAMLQDITALKEAERQAAELAVKNQSVQSLRTYLSHFSHDLRNPLAVMVTSLYLLKHKIGAEANAAGASQMEALNRQIENMTQMVENMSEIFRLDHSLDTLDTRPVHLNSVVEGVLHKMTTNARVKNQTLTYMLCEEPVFVLGDSERLRRVVTNLVQNAVQYTPEGGSVHVDLRVANERAIIEVHDTGVGISEEHLPLIFDHFFRVDKARSTTEGSAGLGLTIVRKIVEAHHGVVEVSSTPGVGSTFRVTLPLTNPS